MRKSKKLPILLLAIATTLLVLSGCAANAQTKPAIRALIVPKFEIGEMTGDFPGEAQLFYERYCPGCEEIEIPHMPETAHFYCNEDTGAAILVTGSGKTAAGLSLMSLLASDDYDFSDAYIISVGCAGGSVGRTIFGDVALVTAACDRDLGFYVDNSAEEDTPDPVEWFPNEDFEAYSHKDFNADLCENAFEMVKDCPLQTTERSKEILVKSFGEENLVHKEAVVLKGTAITSDEYWKGDAGHDTAAFIADYYGCADPYAVTEMEEIAIANAANCFGMLDRVISFLVIVNMDQFLYFQSPHDLWKGGNPFTSSVDDDSGETLDVFKPGMQNLYDVSSIVIDDILNGAPNLAA